MDLAELWFIPGSPWSLRARWALELCEVPVRKRVYRPFIDQPRLFWKLGRPWGEALFLTVPVLFLQKGQPLRHGIDIARWAATKSGSETLFPQSGNSSNLLVELCDKAETIMSYLRTAKFTVLFQDLDLLQRLYFPRPLQNRWFSGVLARLSRWLFLRKYKAPAREDAVAALQYVSRSLESSASQYLLGGDSLSYADIAVATSLLFAIPKDVSNAAWVRSADDERLCLEFKDLTQWRQRVFKELPFDQADALNFRPRKCQTL